MNLEQALSIANEFFRTGNLHKGMNTLSEVFTACIKQPETRDLMLAWVVHRVEHPDPEFGAHIAVVGGALVENGAPAESLGRAIVAPIEASLVCARRLLERADKLPDEPGDDSLPIGDRQLSPATIRGIAEEDVDAVNGWISLETWFRPAVAAWSRATGVLREVQASPTFRTALDRVGRTTATSHWLSQLIETVLDAPFIVLVPELKEAWSVRVDGVVDMGQLTVLLSEALADPLARIGASGVAKREVLDVMGGVGPQQAEGAYSSTFSFYPIEALDPADRMPRDGVHTWSAPGGTGTHSLPPDFLPGTLPVRDGSRVLAMVGPKAPGMRFARLISAVRTFDPLVAKVSGAAKLPDDQAARWLALKG
jgi:hypothetical protein